MSIQISGKSSKRTHADLNLVPYIDLLTCMVAFLLITAVWTQLVRLQVQQRGHGSTTDAEPRAKVVVMVGEVGFNVMVDQDRQILPLRTGGHDFPALREVMAKLKLAYPDREDVLVASEDGIAFDTLVGTMDTLLSAGFPAMSLVEPGAAGL